MTVEFDLAYGPSVPVPLALLILAVWAVAGGAGLRAYLKGQWELVPWMEVGLFVVCGPIGWARLVSYMTRNW